MVVVPESLDGALVEVRGDAHRHLFRARRLAPGEEIRVVDGAGGARLGVVVTVERDVALVRLEDPLPALAPRRELTLWVAVPRLERASWLVEKATELGVAGIAWFESARTQRELRPKHLARLERVAAAALEQCGGATLPEIVPPLSWQELLGELEDPRAEALVLDPSCPGPLPDPVGGLNPLHVVVGPEGGFTAEELAALRAIDVAPWWLGPRTLRVETAAITAAALAVTPAAASTELEQASVDQSSPKS